MTITARAVAVPGEALSSDVIRRTLDAGLAGRFHGSRVLVLVPDTTRTLPLPMLFRMLTSLLRDAERLSFMVALGTHRALSQSGLNRLFGITPSERATIFRHVTMLNHAWDDPDSLVWIGTLQQEEVQQIAGEAWHPSLGSEVPVRVNRVILEHDHILILGPTFPHEVAGFSGGAKYLFPGISGPEVINTTHWLGALVTVLNTIGRKETPVRAMIHAAAEKIPIPITLVSMVVNQGLAGMFVGDHISAWHVAADLSSDRHIAWVERPFRKVLSCPPMMYDDLWTAAKAMYKLEPVVADGGELIIYAPHLSMVSHVHGKHIYEAGYHVLDYYLKQWDRFRHLPLAVLAHGTHLRGTGRFEGNVEHARIQVTLASRISEADCRRLSLGYTDPKQINPEAWRKREDEGILFVPKAGETLYRVRAR